MLTHKNVVIAGLMCLLSHQLNAEQRHLNFRHDHTDPVEFGIFKVNLSLIAMLHGRSEDYEKRMQPETRKVSCAAKFQTMIVDSNKNDPTVAAAFARIIDFKYSAPKGVDIYLNIRTDEPANNYAIEVIFSNGNQRFFHPLASDLYCHQYFPENGVPFSHNQEQRTLDLPATKAHDTRMSNILNKIGMSERAERWKTIEQTKTSQALEADQGFDEKAQLVYENLDVDYLLKQLAMFDDKATIARIIAALSPGTAR